MQMLIPLTLGCPTNLDVPWILWQLVCTSAPRGPRLVSIDPGIGQWRFFLG